MNIFKIDEKEKLAFFCEIYISFLLRIFKPVFETGNGIIPYNPTKNFDIEGF